MGGIGAGLGAVGDGGLPPSERVAQGAVHSELHRTFGTGGSSPLSVSDGLRVEISAKRSTLERKHSRANQVLCNSCRAMGQYVPQSHAWHRSSQKMTL